jgi:zinc/manganese transport system substrate-binding protein
MKSIRSSLLSALIAAAFMTGGAHAALKIVTTTTDLAAIAEYVGGDKVTVSSIVPGNQDPHFVEAKPSYMLMCKDADLFIRVGMSLEVGYEQPIIDGSRNSKIRIGSPGHLDLSQGIRRLEVPTAKVTRGLGDVHPEGNPHYWVGPYNARIMAEEIGERLSQLDPANADYYDARARRFVSEINERMFGAEIVQKIGSSNAWTLQHAGKLKQTVEKRGIQPGGWFAKLMPYQGAPIVTYHRSWVYFTDDFQLKVLDELEPKPGIPPSPGHVADVIRQMKQLGTKVLLMEPFYDRRPADRVAQETGAKVVEVANSVGGSKEATDYFSTIDQIVNGLASALGS